MDVPVAADVVEVDVVGVVITNCNCCDKTNRLILQLHITAKCNQKCLHCYHEKYAGEELNLNEIEKVIEQYKELLNIYIKNSTNIKGHVNITGGEPFIRRDILDILKILHTNREYFSFGILTNGTYLNDENCKKLKEYGVSFVQVSIDGTPKTHDYIRGKGDFKKTIKALKILRKHRIRSMISFTAHKDNYMEYPYIARTARKYRVYKLWTDRLVPMGNGKEMESNLLSPEEMLEYLNIVKQEQDKQLLNRSYGTIIEMNRALNFLKTGKTTYTCSAGNSLITILENGDVLPCRRMPIPTENILDKSLKDIYFNNEVFKNLRKEREPDIACSKCLYFNICKGGSRCISYAVNGTPFGADPSCPIAYANNNIDK